MFPAWFAVITQKPAETNVITVPVSATVQTSRDSLVYETVKPVDVLSDDLTEVAIGDLVNDPSVNGISSRAANTISCAVEPVLKDFFVGSPLTV